ncbi:MAG TPA: class I SAM-dependent methyltransferase [Kutzneria sp.]|nr:class I SAM-dependent methyltransferase [Kutzneria sp.]
MTASQFEELAHLYEKSFEVWPYRRDVEQYSVLQALGDVTGLAALDLGCGSGGYTRLLAAHGAKPVVGLDGAAGMIDHAWRREAEDPCGASFVLHDAAEPMAGAFDVVLAVHLLPYAETFDALVAMCASARSALTGPGKRFVTVTINPGFAREPGYYRRYGFDLIAPSDELHDGDPIRLHSEFGGGTIDVTPHYWSRATQERALLQAGFRAVTWWDPVCSPTADVVHFSEYLRQPPTLVVTATT